MIVIHLNESESNNSNIVKIEEKYTKQEIEISYSKQHDFEEELQVEAVSDDKRLANIFTHFCSH